MHQEKNTRKPRRKMLKAGQIPGAGLIWAWKGKGKVDSYIRWGAKTGGWIKSNKHQVIWNISLDHDSLKQQVWAYKRQMDSALMAKTTGNKIKYSAMKTLIDMLYRKSESSVFASIAMCPCHLNINFFPCDASQ